MPTSDPITSVAIIDEDILRDKIHEIRGQKVMLDFDLAEIYGYTTKAFNRQVKNNIEKFEGDDFMFQLTDEERQNLKCDFCTSSSRCKNCTLNADPQLSPTNLRCQNGTLNTDPQDNPENLRPQNVTSTRGSNLKYNPHAFTEQGIYMLMTVLRGDLATRQSRALVRLFKRLKDRVIEHQDLIGRREFLLLSMQVTDSRREVADLRRELAEVDERVYETMESLGDLVTESELAETLLELGNPTARRDYFLLNNCPVEANQAYAEVYAAAQKSIFVIDNYIGMKTLVLLKAAHPGVKITLFSDNKGRGLTQSELADFRKEYPDIDLDLRKAGGIFHDRFIVLDFDEETEAIYLCGASSKDAGTLASSISQLADAAPFRDLITRLLTNPPLPLRAS